MLSSLKCQKNNYSSTDDWWEYTKSHLKKSARILSKNSTKENYENFQTKQEVKKPLQKRKFKSESKPMIENLPDELYQMESEYEKDAEHHANIILKLEGEKCSKTYFNVLERQYAKPNNFWVI